MKRLFLCFALSIGFLPLCAQKDQKALPSFGKLEPSELSQQECIYDKDAEAEVLLDYADMAYMASASLVTTEVQYRVRIKILKEKGLDRANITIPYYHDGNDEQITRLEAVTYNPDASGGVVSTKLEKGSIYDKKVNKRWSEIVFSMPNVKVGSVIEYRYKKTSKGFNLSNWYFQRDIPVRYSCYNVALPTFLRFAESARVYLPVEVKKEEGVNKKYHSYIMRNIPALRVEPFMSTPKDYLQKLEFRLIAIDIPGEPVRNMTSTWRAVGKALLEDEDFGSVIKKNINLPEEVAQKLKQLSDKQQKMVTIHDYVRQNMIWNEKYSIWALDGIKKAWEKKTGNSGEINLILINLLKDAGLEVFPLMVSTRTNGRVNTVNPSLHEFNNVLAYVEIDGARYVLDGTDKITPFSMIPHDVAFTEGLLVRGKEDSRWVTLDPNKKLYTVMVYVYGELTADGFLKGTATIRSYDYSRSDRIRQWKQGKDKFTETYFSKPYPSMKIEEVSLKNETIDSLPLEQTVKFNLPTNSSGDYSYFTTNLFLGLENNSFIAENRFTDIDFGYNQSYSLVGRFEIPEGYQVEELPKNMKMIMPDTSISLLRMYDKNEKQVGIRVNLDFKRPVYSVDEYELFQEFYKLLYAALNEQIVLRRKKQ